MKKQITAIITAALILANFTACSTSTDTLGNSSDISDEISGSVSNNSEHGISNTDSDSSSNTPISSAESTFSSSENISSGITEDLNPSSVNNFPESFTGYLGETLHGADASEQFGNVVFFDGFTYLRWMKPIFDSTLKTPDLINWDTYDIAKYDTAEKRNDPQWFLAKTGDKLENGLVVKSASCGFEEARFTDGTKAILLVESAISFENTLTLTGVLYCEPEDDVYVIPGDLVFFADPTVGPNVPVISQSGKKAGEYSLNKYVAANFAAVFDGKVFNVGNLESAAVDLSGIINEGESCEVRVTLDNIKITTSERFMGGAFADIVSIEKINN